MTTLLEDKDAIRELLHRYCFCMDEGRFAELAALFAEDGEWIAPYRTAKGPADIAAWLKQSVPSRPRRMHYVMNSISDVDGTRATSRSNYLVMVEGANGPVPSVCGTYDDVLVKQPDGWHFQRRRLIHAFKGEMALLLSVGPS
jgi:3-phenylpropionate/cinnamic acid dioxygenase small subunit